MPTIDLTADTYDETVARDGIVVVDAWAAWCGPCRMFAPVFEAAAAAHPDHLFAKLDTQAHPDLTRSLGIEHIPALVVYRDSIMLYNKAGSPSAEILDDILSQVESLDMDVVRQDISKQE